MENVNMHDINTIKDFITIYNDSDEMQHKFALRLNHNIRVETQQLNKKKRDLQQYELSKIKQTQEIINIYNIIKKLDDDNYILELEKYCSCDELDKVFNSLIETPLDFYKLCLLIIKHKTNEKSLVINQIEYNKIGENITDNYRIRYTFTDNISNIKFNGVYDDMIQKKSKTIKLEEQICKNKINETDKIISQYNEVYRTFNSIIKPRSTVKPKILTLSELRNYHGIIKLQSICTTEEINIILHNIDKSPSNYAQINDLSKMCKKLTDIKNKNKNIKLVQITWTGAEDTYIPRNFYDYTCTFDDETYFHL